MQLERLTKYLLKHRLQAIVLTFLISCIPLIGMVGILIAAFMTLCVGIFEGAVFTLAATLPSLILFIWIQVYLGGTQEAASMSNWATIVLTVAGNFLTWAFAVLLRRKCSWTFILQTAALSGVLVISVVHLVYPHVADWWAGQLTSIDQMASSYSQSPDVAASLSKESQHLEPLKGSQLDVINTVKGFATGIVTAFALFAAVFQVALARLWQVTVVNHGRMGRELQYVRLSHLAGMLFIASIVFYYLENLVVLDILPVLFLLFSVAGLSLVHYICGLMEPTRGRFWLSVLYIALMYSLTMMAMLPVFTQLNMMLPVALAILILSTCIFAFVLLGLFDVWLDVRKRFRKV